MDIFVYGTLKSHALMATVAGPGVLHSSPAILAEYAVRPIADNVVPFIEKQSGATAQGLIWKDLTPEQVSRLDLYEGAFDYPRQTIEVKTDNGLTSAQCYMPPDGLAVGNWEWSLDDWEAGHLAPAILAAQEIFTLDPLPTPEKLRGMWGMIEARAWSKHRAAAAPATRRYLAKDGDFDAELTGPTAGAFFRFLSADVEHRTFDGGRSGRLVREGFIGVDAAIVLPYDPVRDRVVLVEQARMGPRLRHDPNPWMLEPVAGIIDAREAPEQTARREAQEEAGLAITTLEPAGQFYVSPGGSTDYFYTFVGLCDIAQSQTYLGGLPQEGEDLRLHPMSFDEALALADSGEIATGPALFLLHWLLRHRDRLRLAR